MSVINSIDNHFGNTPGGYTMPIVDGLNGQTLTTNGAGVASWQTGGAGSGNVVGPVSSVDGDIVLFSGATGKIIKDSGFQITSGSFSPILAFNGSSTGIIYAVQYGRYMQIGNTVAFEMQITLSNKGSSTGNATLGGLPIPNDAFQQLVTFTSDGSISFPAGATTLVGNLPAAGTSVTLFGLGSSTLPHVTDVNFNNSSTIAVYGTYFTS